MKLDLKGVVILVLFSLVAYQFFFNKKEVITPEPKIITIPESSGIIIDTVEIVKRDTVYLPREDRIVEVDAGWNQKYNEAVDSLERQKLFYKSITINEYSNTLIDNDTIRIDGTATTRGSLLSYSVDYKIKSFDFEYTPEVVTKRPDLSVGFGLEAGLPTGPMSDFRVKGTMYFENENGAGFSFGADTKETLWLGLRKTFKLKD